ncbi:TPA: helicase-exonuclease AddAB subunit AddA [Streptococcus suis]
MIDQYAIEAKPQGANYNDEQWQAIQEKGHNLLVAASAGSGKTTVLIERILTHIRRGFASIDQLLVVTFTEAAAGEMKERMEVKLKAALLDPDQADLHQLYRQEIEKLPTAHIRTLHSFCLQVIQAYFYLIDFNPSFSLLTDETQKMLLYQKSWDQVLEAVMAGQLDDLTKDQLTDLLSRYAQPRDDRGLFDLVLDLYLFSSSHPEPELWLEHLHQHSSNFQDFTRSSLFTHVLKPTLQAAIQNAYQLLVQAEDLLEGASDETCQKYGDLIASERSQVGAILDSLYTGDLAGLVGQVQGLDYLRWPTKPRKTEEGDLIDSLKGKRDQAKKLMVEQVAKVFPLDLDHLGQYEEKLAPIIEALGRLTLHFKRFLNQEKRANHLLDYNDLEHLTLDILAPYDPSTGQRQASIAALYYQDLFREVLVDEYQDINEIQAAILSWLSHEKRPDLRGNLFMVGDVKQSIYGFRMAEPSLFMAKYRAYQEGEGGRLIVLDKNYRSRDEVLQFTNLVFQRLMDDDFGQMPYGIQESLKTGNHSFLPPAPDPAFNVQFLLHEKDGQEGDQVSEAQALDDLNDDLGFDDAIQAQAHLIAQDISAKIGQGTLIYDKATKSMRPLAYKDIVILTATRSPFLSLQQTFQDYQIPLNAQKVDTYFQRQEIQLMIALLKLIDNPQQDLPLTAILRSFFVGLDDEALSHIRIKYPSGPYHQAVRAYAFRQEDELAETLQAFYQKLDHWADLAGSVRLVDLIWTIYQDTYFLDYVAGLTNGSQRQANLHAFYEHAASFEASDFKGVFGFIRYIEEVTTHNEDIAEPLILSEDENYVRVMTVHASKGLEFPLVYLMHLNKRFNLSDVRNKRYVLSKHYGLGSDLYDYSDMVKYPSLVKETIKLERTLALKAEEMRKLYVALTRCEQLLILVGSISSKEKWEDEGQEIRDLSKDSKGMIHLQKRQGGQSWLEWLHQAISLGNDTSPVPLATFKMDQITTTFVSEQDLAQNKPDIVQTYHQVPGIEWVHQTLEAAEKMADAEAEGAMSQQIEAYASFIYPHLLASRTSSYQSVSELKRLYEEPAHQKLGHFMDRSLNKTSHSLRDKSLTGQGADRLLESEELEDKSAQSRTNAHTQEDEGIQSIRFTGDTFLAPTFMQESQLSYAQIGTLTHFVMQHLDLDHAANSQDMTSFLASEMGRLQADGILSDSELAVIKVDSLLAFLSSKEGQELIQYRERVEREQAFSYLLPAKWLFKAQLHDLDIEALGQDQLLIHGIIDTYYETPDGLVILDYKTDRYQHYGSRSRQDQIQQIADKYRFQVSLYAQALGKAKGQTVDKVGLVLLDFKQVYWYQDLYRFEGEGKF